MGLKDNLPEFVSEEKYTKEVLEAIQPEIDDIKIKLAGIIAECCVTSCSEIGIRRFEKDYSVPYNVNLSLDERKRRIINKMLNKKVLTMKELFEFVKRNLNGAQFYISNMAEEYAFRIMILEEGLREELFGAIKNVRPAHLKFDIKIVKYERRCNTFCSGSEPV